MADNYNIIFSKLPILIKSSKQFNIESNALIDGIFIFLSLKKYPNCFATIHLSPERPINSIEFILYINEQKQYSFRVGFYKFVYSFRDKGKQSFIIDIVEDIINKNKCNVCPFQYHFEDENGKFFDNWGTDKIYYFSEHPDILMYDVDDNYNLIKHDIHLNRIQFSLVKLMKNSLE